MRIQNNIMAMNTHRSYTTNTNSVAKSAEKLSSGYRINRAGDDAAGLAISEKMRAQIAGLTMASKNSQDAISLVQTAEGALQEVHTMLQRMNELAVQSASGTNDSNVDRAALQQEFQNLQDEIDQIAATTTFNDMQLLDGGLDGRTTYETKDATGKDVVGVAAQSEGDLATQPTGQATVSITATASGSIEGEVDLASVTITVNIATDGAAGSSVSVSGTWGGGGATLELNIQRASDAEWGAGTDITKLLNDALIAANEAGGADMPKEGASSIKFFQEGYVEKDAAVAGTFNLVLSKQEPTDNENSLRLQVGAEQSQILDIDVGAMNTTGLKITKDDVKIDTQDSAQVAITATRSAINIVSTQRAELGAMQNRLEHKISNLDNTAENLQAAESRIRDVDIAKEMTAFTKSNILLQASTAMLAQANAAPQGVLSLLQ